MTRGPHRIHPGRRAARCEFEVDGPAGPASANTVCQRHEYAVQHRVLAGQRPDLH